MTVACIISAEQRTIKTIASVDVSHSDICLNTPNTSEIKPVWVRFQTGLNVVGVSFNWFEFGTCKQVALFQLV